MQAALQAAARIAALLEQALQGGRIDRPGKLAWHSANGRNRRIFDDRTGLRPVHDGKPVLPRSDRRNSGGGPFVRPEAAAAPITVAGRHWGGARPALRV
ncbi:MAG: hypothetical protein JNL87_01605 [Burkholderiaceae bacterium]|nr:hypothetical protein [Burkholderiaceae bacterium]